MNQLKAIIFDVDGTLANTEEIHRRSFNEAFAEAGFGEPWTPGEYVLQLAISGGRERIMAWLRSPDGGGMAENRARELAISLHQRKSEIYRNHLRAGHIAPRPGVLRLIREAGSKGIQLGIATSTSRANVETLLDCILDRATRTAFTAIATSDIVADKKPAPAVYQFCLARLGVDPGECVAIEDTANGNLAALACGIATVITVHEYTRDNNFAGAALVLDQLGEPDQPCRIMVGNARGRKYVDTGLLQKLIAREAKSAPGVSTAPELTS